MKRHGLLILFFTSCLTSPLHANSTRDLWESYQLALEKDPQIAGARYAMEAGEEKTIQGRSGLLPQVNANGSVSYNYTKLEFEGTSPDQSKKSDSRSVALSVAQPIYRSANFTAYDQSKLFTEQAKIQFSLAQQSLILRVAQAYFDVLSAEESYSVAKSQTVAFNESLERAILTFKVGTATKTDKLEAQARYDLARAAELSAQNQVAISKQILGSITGEKPEQVKIFDKKSSLIKIDPEDMQQWVDTAVNNNLQLKTAATSLEISQFEISKLKGDRLPTLDFFAEASNRKQFFIGNETTTTQLSVGLQLAMPLYTGGLMTSRIREAEFLRSQSQELKSDTQRQIILQTQSAYLNALNGYQQVEALKQALISSESALDATRKGMEVGVRTNLDLLNAQQQYFETERDFSLAKYNYLLSVLQLKAAAGTLVENDLKDMNALLQP